MQVQRSSNSIVRILLATSLGLFAVNSILAADATPAPAAVAAEPAAELDEIVVSSFRASLDAALNVKRESVASVDVVVAEDIAKFPDQNLAESLQRIPGISIQRDGGEGRAITVRGLGPQFTRVRVNGMETVATSADGASANRDRAFDFNVFASELFTSLVVHKTAEASLDEGSLGAVVDLNTGNPLAGKPGITAVGSLQGSYNDLSSTTGPRMAGLLSWKSDAGNFGASVSAAYSNTDTLESGNNTVRWQQARFASVGGVNCFTTPLVGGTYVSSAGCNAVSLAFHPRIPRYGVVGHDRTRLGMTGSLQWAPSERSKLSLDALYSRFKEDREERWLEVLFRGNERSIAVTNYAIDGNNNQVSGTFNNAYVRTEHYLRQQDTRFYQIGLNWKQELTDKARIELLAGTSKSDADIPLETTIALDDREATGFTYDYTNSRSPLIAFGSSVSDPANFQLAEIRDRPSNTTNTFRTLALKGEWDMNDQFQLQGGAVYRRFSFDVTEAARDTLVCPAKTTAAPDVVLGTINCTISSGNSTVFGPTAVYGFPVTTALTQLFNLGDSGQPAGTTSSFIIANLANAAGFTNLYGRAAIPNNSNIRGVVESDEGAFMQFNGKGELFGLRYAANGGVRYMKTKQSSTGINNGVTVEIAREYNDTLPSFNVALFPTEDFIVRLAASKVMTRPNLANLTPGGSVSGFLYTVSFGNPALDPFRAKAYDLSFEYYFAPESIFSVALFKKDVSSFPVSTTRSGTYASTGLPLSLILAGSPASSAPEGQPWAISTIGNGSGASLKGVEIAIQAPFKFLPGIWSNFGGIANATFVDSSAIYNVGVPAILPTPVTAALAIGSTATAATLFGLSRQAYNGTIYYEGKKFSARASWSYRSPFVDGTSATGNAFEGYNSSKNVDASVKYRINEMIELSLEGVNLTDDYRDRFTDLVANRNYEYNHFGRTFMAGVRVKL